VTGLRGRAAIAGGALIMMAGLVIPAATATTATAATTPTAGIDVSSIQDANGAINWADVAAAGKAFTGIKASEGKYYTNSYFPGDVKSAIGQKLYVIPYAFANPFDPATNGTAIQQADVAATEVSTVSTVSGAANYMLPLAIDLESDPYAANDNTNQCYGLSTSAMVTWIKGFITEYDSKLPETRPLIIYTTADWWDTCTGSSTAFTSHPLWLASYGVTNPALPVGWNNYTFWQYSAGGSVSGITGAVDLDYLGPILEASQVSKAIGSVQLTTLGKLDSPSTSVTYSVPSAELPAGLSLSSSGLISGTPTAIGHYSVTVTPSAGAAMPINWYVHGTLTVTSPGNHTTTAGTPVWLRVAASDTDAGYTPSFAASGLPPGLSITSGGVISGWPYKAGTYHVTVAASDGLYASGSATFTWTVNAAPASGATGTIKQWGGSGKCLDDSGYGTSNGSHVDLWSCTGRWNQNWTFAQDGTVHVGSKCLDVTGEGTANGTKLQLWACNSGDGAQQWLADSQSQLINPQSGKCLYVPNSNAPNGTRPEIWTCATANTANYHWLRPAANVYSGNAGKCLAASGTTAVLANCANTSAQHWTESWNGTLQLGTKCLNATGSGVSVGSCSGATSWQLRGVGTLPLGTEIVSATSGQCVTAPSATNGVALQMQTCSDTDGATWHAE
jgi:GH25 family lysozyme M1 (1,4-beta-N-acetylmuramidase)